jgi:hypothetical protein
MFSKGISWPFTARNGSKPRGFWHLTLCTLLSSQGSDAPDFRPIRLSLRGTSMLFLVVRLVSNYWIRSELHQAVQSEESLSFLLGVGPA